MRWNATGQYRTETNKSKKARLLDRQINQQRVRSANDGKKEWKAQNNMNHQIPRKKSNKMSSYMRWNARGQCGTETNGNKKARLIDGQINQQSVRNASDGKNKKGKPRILQINRFRKETVRKRTVICDEMREGNAKQKQIETKKQDSQID